MMLRQLGVLVPLLAASAGPVPQALALSASAWAPPRRCFRRAAIPTSKKLGEQKGILGLYAAWSQCYSLRIPSADHPSQGPAGPPKSFCPRRSDVSRCGGKRRLVSFFQVAL